MVPKNTFTCGRVNDLLYHASHSCFPNSFQNEQDMSFYSLAIYRFYAQQKTLHTTDKIHI